MKTEDMIPAASLATLCVCPSTDDGEGLLLYVDAGWCLNEMAKLAAIVPAGTWLVLSGEGIPEHRMRTPRALTKVKAA